MNQIQAQTTDQIKSADNNVSLQFSRHRGDIDLLASYKIKK